MANNFVGVLYWPQAIMFQLTNALKQPFSRTQSIVPNAPKPRLRTQLPAPGPTTIPTPTPIPLFYPPQPTRPRNGGYEPTGNIPPQVSSGFRSGKQGPIPSQILHGGTPSEPIGLPGNILNPDENYQGGGFPLPFKFRNVSPFTQPNTPATVQFKRIRLMRRGY